MTDPRLFPANSRVAAAELHGQISAHHFTDGTWRRISVPVADLLRAPGGKRDRQLLFGQRVRVLEILAGVAFVQSARDGYVGYVAADALDADGQPTHRVAARATHLYPAPDLKRHEVNWLSHGSLLAITGREGAYAETDEGFFVPSAHLAPLDAPAPDPVATARLYLGAPYLWGGNSAAGIDCSGLVQAALIAAGHPCPGDSDLQFGAFGQVVDDADLPRPGDLYFWKGHVAMATDETTLIHANAHHMAVVEEPVETVMARAAAQPGEFLGRKRPG